MRFFRLGRNGGAAASHAERLNRTRLSLRLLNEKSESGFLEVAAALTAIRDAAQSLTAEASRLSAEIAGTEASQIRGALEDVLKQALAAHGNAGTVGAGLHNLAASVPRIQDPARNLVAAARVFRVLGVQLRIENARSHSSSADFTPIADEVYNLAAAIVERVGEITAAAELLRQVIRDSSRFLEDWNGRQTETLPEIIARSRSGIEELNRMQEKAHSAAVVVEVKSRQVFEQVSNLVISLQSHDIARQQIEHVIDAIEPAASPTRKALELQTAQLGQARKTLLNAFDEIGRSLGKAAADVRSLAEAPAQVAAGGNRDGAFEEIEKSISTLSAVLEDFARADAEVNRSVASVAATAGKMESFVGAVDGVASRMRLVGVNAQIKAAWLGDSGQSLAALANNVREVAVNACTETGRAAEAITEIGQSAGRFSGSAADGGEEAGLDQMAARVGELTRHLHSASREHAERLRQIAEQALDLVAAIESARASALNQEPVRQAFTECEQTLRAVTGEMSRQAEAPTDRTRRELHNLAKHYTMSSERLVHHSMAGGAAPGPGEGNDPPPEVRATAPDADFGENVELF